MLWIAFTRDKSLISRAIRWVTKGHFSHVLLLWHDAKMGGWLKMEAGWDGYHVRPIRSGPSLPDLRRLSGLIEDEVSVTFPIDDRYDGLLKICAAWLGTPYDYPGIAGYLWTALGRVIKKRWKNPTNSPSALFCSEAVTQGLQRLGDPAVKDLVPSETTPQDLFDKIAEGRVHAWVYRGD